MDVSGSAVLHLSNDTGLSPYDCEYVVLADHLRTRLLTYDRPVLKAVPEVALRPDRFARSG